MIYIALGVQLLIMISLSLFFNKKKLYIRGANIYIVSFLEGLGTFFIILSLLLEGYIINPLLQVLFFIIGGFIIVFSGNSINDGQIEMDIQLETLKNIVVTYTSTVLLLFVTLSIFRFQPFYIQVSLSLVIVVLFNLIAVYMKKWFSILWDKFSFNSSMFVNFNVVYLFIAFFAVFLLTIFFNFPKVAVNQFLNLNDSNTYFSYPNGSNDLINRYQEHQAFEIHVDLDKDINAYMNQKDQYVLIYIDNQLLIYDINQDQLVYSGSHIDVFNTITIPATNEENDESRYQTHCVINEGCLEYEYPFVYGDVEYRTIEKIFRFDHLSYDHSDTMIYTDGIIHLFEQENIDSRVSAIKERPFIGFGHSSATITDVDNYQGKISYLLLDQEGQSLSIKLFNIIEEDVDLELPFYSHYRFGFILMIMLLGFIPVTNYDKYRE